MPPDPQNVQVQNFPASQTIEGTVSINNFPDPQNVNLQNSGTDVSIDNPLSVDVTTMGGSRPTIGTFDQLIIAYEVRDIAVKWEYEVYETNYDMLPVINTGDGAQSFDSGMLVVSSAATGTIKAQSQKVTRYRTGNGGFAWFTFRSNGGSGIGGIALESDEDDQIFLRENNGVIEFGYSKQGVELNVVNSASFNGEANVGAIDWTDLKIFKFEYGYLGAAFPKLLIKQNGRTFVLHDFLKDTTSNTTYVRFPQFRLSLFAENGASVQSASWAAGTYSNVLETRGEDPSARPFFSGTERTFDPPTTPEPIVAFQIKDTYNSFTHTVQAKLLNAIFATSAEGLYEIEFWFNANTITGGSFVDINTLSSVTEINEGVTAFTGGIRKFSLPIAISSAGTGVAAKDLDFEKLGVFLNRGDNVVITIREIVTGGGSDIHIANFNWQELF